MRSVSGHVAHPPRHLVSATTSVADRLGRDVVSNDLWLIGLTEIDVTPARQVLETEGLSASYLMDAVRTEGDRPSEAPTGQMFPPSFNGMLGRAQAFAATLGDGTITPEHVLLA